MPLKLKSFRRRDNNDAASHRSRILTKKNYNLITGEKGYTTNFFLTFYSQRVN